MNLVASRGLTALSTTTTTTRDRRAQFRTASGAVVVSRERGRGEVIPALIMLTTTFRSVLICPSASQERSPRGRAEPRGGQANYRFHAAKRRHVQCRDSDVSAEATGKRLFDANALSANKRRAHRQNKQEQAYSAKS